MTKKQYLESLRKNYLVVILITVTLMALVFFITLLQPLNYASTTEVMVIQKQLTETDSYLSAKTAEKVAGNLTQVVYSTSFFDKVEKTGFADLSELAVLDEKDKREQWGKTVVAEVVPQTGIIQVTAYNPDPQEAENIANAVAYTLSTQSTDYHGGGENIQVKVINTALTSNYPVKPNIFVNLALAMLVGLTTSLLYLFLRPEVKFSVKKKEVEQIEEVEEVAWPMDGVEATGVSYSVLDHQTFPEVEESTYSQAPRVSTMLDHLK